MINSGRYSTTCVTPVTAVTATGATSTSSSTFATISTMTFTPPAGTYLFVYSGNSDISTNDEGEVALFLGGTQQTHTTREVRVTASGILGAQCSATMTTHTVAKLTCDGSQVVDVRFRAVSGTLTAEERSFTYFPVS